MVREIYFIGKSKNAPFERLEKGISEVVIPPPKKTRIDIDDSISTRTGNEHVQWKIDGNIYGGDHVSDMLHGLALHQCRGDEAVVYLIIVVEDLRESPVSSSKAYLQKCEFTWDAYGDVTFSGVLKAQGNQIYGEAKIVTDPDADRQSCAFIAG